MIPQVPRAVLDAVQMILVEQGIEDVTIRNVARAAGVSVGAVQYHYRTKDELVMAAMDHVAEEFAAGLRNVIDPTGSARSNLDVVCRWLGGVDDASRTVAVVWLAFTSKACTSPTVAQAHQKAWQALEDGLTRLLRTVNEDLGEDDAAGLLALLDGLAIARAAEPSRMDSRRAQAIISKTLVRLCGAP